MADTDTGPWRLEERRELEAEHLRGGVVERRVASFPATGRRAAHRAGIANRERQHPAQRGTCADVEEHPAVEPVDEAAGAGAARIDTAIAVLRRGAEQAQLGTDQELASGEGDVKERRHREVELDRRDVLAGRNVLRVEHVDAQLAVDGKRRTDPAAEDAADDESRVEVAALIALMRGDPDEGHREKTVLPLRRRRRRRVAGGWLVCSGRLLVVPGRRRLLLVVARRRLLLIAGRRLLLVAGRRLLLVAGRRLLLLIIRRRRGRLRDRRCREGGGADTDQERQSERSHVGLLVSTPQH